MEIRRFALADLAVCRQILETEDFVPPNEYFVADHDGRVVACGGFEIGPGAATLAPGAVLPECRGMGVGRFLLFFCLREIGKHTGVEYVRASTSSPSAFLEKQGFRPDATGLLVKRLAVCE